MLPMLNVLSWANRVIAVDKSIDSMDAGFEELTRTLSKCEIWRRKRPVNEIFSMRSE
jgi:hypothetical protein